MRSFEFCGHFPPLGIARAPRQTLAGQERLIENFAKEGRQEGLPLGTLPLWGREGVNITTTTEDFLNNS